MIIIYTHGLEVYGDDGTLRNLIYWMLK